MVSWHIFWFLSQTAWFWIKPSFSPTQSCSLGSLQVEMCGMCYMSKKSPETCHQSFYLNLLVDHENSQDSNYGNDFCPPFSPDERLILSSKDFVIYHSWMQIDIRFVSQINQNVFWVVRVENCERQWDFLG